MNRAALSLALAAIVGCSPSRSPRKEVRTPDKASTVSSPTPSSLGQSLADREIARLMEDSSIEEAAIVALDVPSATIAAVSGGERTPDGRPVSHPEVADRLMFVPGSVMKVFSVALALELGTVRLDQMFEGHGGRWTLGTDTITDVEPHDSMSIEDILAWSSNVGAAQIALTYPKERLAASLGQLGFGLSRPATFSDRPPVGGVEAWSDGDRIRVACGHAGMVTPLQLATAFLAVASGGVRRDPRHRSAGPTPPSEERSAPSRVMKEETATRMLKLLEGVVHRPDGTGTKARVPGYRVAGKTGTSDARESNGKKGTFATFMGAVPASAPRLVIVVTARTTQPGASGGSVAAPAFQRLAEPWLASLQRG